MMASDSSSVSSSGLELGSLATTPSIPSFDFTRIIEADHNHISNLSVQLISLLKQIVAVNSSTSVSASTPNTLTSSSGSSSSSGTNNQTTTVSQPFNTKTTALTEVINLFDTLLWHLLRHDISEHLVMRPAFTHYLGQQGVSMAQHDEADHKEIKARLLRYRRELTSPTPSSTDGDISSYNARIQTQPPARVLQYGLPPYLLPEEQQQENNTELETLPQPEVQMESQHQNQHQNQNRTQQNSNLTHLLTSLQLLFREMKSHMDEETGVQLAKLRDAMTHNESTRLGREYAVTLLLTPSVEVEVEIDVDVDIRGHSHSDNDNDRDCDSDDENDDQEYRDGKTKKEIQSKPNQNLIGKKKKKKKEKKKNRVFQGGVNEYINAETTTFREIMERVLKGDGRRLEESVMRELKVLGLGCEDGMKAKL